MKKADFLKKANVKTEEEFYEKFPTKESYDTVFKDGGDLKKRKKNSSNITPKERKLLDFIGKHESNGGNYNIIYGGKTVDNLTDMTVKEVLEFQKQMVKDGSPSSAIGAHQFINKTLEEEIKKQKIDLNSKFSPELQDSLMVNRLKTSRGFDKFLKGEIDTTTFAKNLSKEFASIPNPETGASYYDGDGLNKSLTDVNSVLSTLNSLKGDKGKGTSNLSPNKNYKPTQEIQQETKIDNFASSFNPINTQNKTQLEQTQPEEVRKKAKQENLLQYTNNINAIPESSSFPSEFNLINKQFKEGGLINEFNVGGSHETNPHGGVAVSENSEGGDNLVQQGETMYKNYIFSDDIELDKDTAKRFNLDDKYIGKSISEISKRFNSELEDRPFDKITKGTVERELNKLMMINEELKPQETNDNQFEGGGLPETPGNTAGALDGVGGVAGIAGMASGVMSIGQDIFGKTGIDTSGATAAPDVQTRGGSALGGAMKGLQAGAATGNPFIMAGGAIVGGIGGLLKGGKENRAAEKAELNHDGMLSMKAGPSTFKNGGLLDTLYPTGGYQEKPVNELIPTGVTGFGDFNYYNTGNKLIDSVNVKSDLSNLNKNVVNPNSINSYIEDKNTKSNNFATNADKFVGKYGNDALRLLPIARNLFKKGPKAETTTFNKLDNRYKPHYMDEAALINQVNNQTRGTNLGLTEASGGDQGGLRANLLQSHINSLKGTSNAFFTADQQNAAQDQFGQSFNKDTDIRNQQITTAETIANEQNRAVAQAQKDAMRNAGVEDLGLYGKENKLGKILSKTTGYTPDGEKYDPQAGFLAQLMKGFNFESGGFLNDTQAEYDAYLKKKYDGSK